MTYRVAGLARSAGHDFGKASCRALTLVAGIGVEGDAHAGARVQHRSRAARDPDQPNLRQVHIIDTGFVSAMARLGHHIGPGDIGENILLDGAGLIDLPVGTSLSFGDNGVVLAVTGLRNPCAQLDRFQPGLMQACLSRNADGTLRRLAGIMAVVINGGDIALDDVVRVGLPALPHRLMGPV